MEVPVFLKLLLTLGCFQTLALAAAEVLYTMPEESQAHEGTWLQWPHHYQYGTAYRSRLDQTWVDMTRELKTSEKVHLVVYDAAEKTRVQALLSAANINLTNVDFKIHKTDDVWVRDNGPIYVRDQSGKLVIQDWGFNGWGAKAAFTNCNTIPAKIGAEQGRAVVDLNATIINEGGSVEADGAGTMMACKSSILNVNRNPGMTQTQAEAIFTKNLGVTNFVWLDGQAGLEITDQHIDGFARFGNSTTIVTMDAPDLINYDVTQADINKLFAAKDKSGKPYTFLKLPLTQNNVVTTYGKNLGYKGSYCNYYIANTKVLVPTYSDPNDAVAINKIKTLYPTRTVVGIDVRNLYANGGMIHCVTQQQPIESGVAVLTEYEQWAATHQLDTSTAGMLVDSDSDGVVNLLEYALGMNPSHSEANIDSPSSTSGLPKLAIAKTGNNSLLKLIFVRRKTDANLIYTPEFGSNLKDFVASTAVPSVEDLGNGWERVQIQDAVTASASRFGRVRVEYR